MITIATLLAALLLAVADSDASEDLNQSRLKRPAITVKDLDRSLALYQDVVGFTVAHQDSRFAEVTNRFDLEMMGLPAETQRRVAILNTSQEARGFVLQSFDPSPAIASQGQLLLVFQTSDFDGLHERLVAAGFEVKMAQTGEGARFREMGVRDPDGHSLTFYMVLPKDLQGH